MKKLGIILAAFVLLFVLTTCNGADDAERYPPTAITVTLDGSPVNLNTGITLTLLPGGAADQDSFVLKAAATADLRGGDISYSWEIANPPVAEGGAIAVIIGSITGDTITVSPRRAATVTITVTASNKYGRLPVSFEINVVGPFDEAPAAPVIHEGSDAAGQLVADRTIEITTAVPQPFFAVAEGAAHFEWEIVSGDTFVSLPPPSGTPSIVRANPVNVTGVAVGQATIRVRAHNNIGHSGWTNFNVNVSLDPDDPRRVTGLTIRTGTERVRTNVDLEHLSPNNTVYRNRVGIDSRFILSVPFTATATGGDGLDTNITYHWTKSSETGTGSINILSPNTGETRITGTVFGDSARITVTATNAYTADVVTRYFYVVVTEFLFVWDSTINPIEYGEHNPDPHYEDPLPSGNTPLIFWNYNYYFEWPELGDWQRIQVRQFGAITPQGEIRLGEMVHHIDDWIPPSRFIIGSDGSANESATNSTTNNQWGYFDFSQGTFRIVIDYKDAVLAGNTALRISINNNELSEGASVLGPLSNLGEYSRPGHFRWSRGGDTWQEDGAHAVGRRHTAQPDNPLLLEDVPTGEWTEPLNVGSGRVMVTFRPEVRWPTPDADQLLSLQYAFISLLATCARTAGLHGHARANDVGMTITRIKVERVPNEPVDW